MARKLTADQKKWAEEFTLALLEEIGDSFTFEVRGQEFSTPTFLPPTKSAPWAYRYGLKKGIADAASGAKTEVENEEKCNARIEALLRNDPPSEHRSAEVTEALDLLEDNGIKVDRKAVKNWPGIEAALKAAGRDAEAFEKVHKMALENVAERVALRKKQQARRKF